jgi:hypothetical protein
VSPPGDDFHFEPETKGGQRFQVLCHIRDIIFRQRDVFFTVNDIEPLFQIGHLTEEFRELLVKNFRTVSDGRTGRYIGRKAIRIFGQGVKDEKPGIRPSMSMPNPQGGVVFLALNIQ